MLDPYKDDGMTKQCWRNDSLDLWYFEYCELSGDKDFLEQRERHLALWRNITKWQAQNDEPYGRHYIIYDYMRRIVDVVCFDSNRLPGNAVAFSSFEKALKCIDYFKNELMWDMYEYKQRLDWEDGCQIE